MNGSRGNATSCYNCGTLNVTGVRSCVNCHAPYYYNCPHCHSWVDISVSDCPYCGNRLNWPREAYAVENIYIPERSAPATILLLMSIIVLSIVAIHLITNNSNPVDAVSHTSDVAITNSLPASGLKTAAQPQIQASSPAPSSPSMIQSEASDSYTQAYADTAEGSIVHEIPGSTADIPAPVTSTATYVPKRSNYLKTAYPNWGHCSGGSCYSACQQ